MTSMQWYIKLRKGPEQDLQNSPLAFHTPQPFIDLPQNIFSLSVKLLWIIPTQLNSQASFWDIAILLPVSL